MNFNEIKALIANEMTQVDEQLFAALKSDVSLIEDIGEHIIASGGKRIRPVLVLLVSKALGLDGKAPIITANIIELIHTATLLHDDVVDSSDMRRGKDTANIAFGNAASVLTGDFIYSRAFELMCELDNMKVLHVLAQASNCIAAGEVQQLQNCNNPEITVDDYMHVIYSKTAKLFEAAAHVPAVLMNSDEKIRQSMIDYGKHLGTAFQIIDDVIDYRSDSETMGKNVGDDLAEGKATLPLIYVLQNGNTEQQQIIRQAIIQGKADIDQIKVILNDTGALDYAFDIAQAEAAKAKVACKPLTDSDSTNALIALADLAISREA